jgi:threonine aldolase
VSGNPGGRPKSKVLSQAYRDVLEQEGPGDSQGRTFAEMIAQVLARRAMKGDVQAARELADRTEGKARQSIAFSQSTDDQFKDKSNEQLEFFAKTGFWPTTEELENHAKNGKWHHEICPKCGC